MNSKLSTPDCASRLGHAAGLAVAAAEAYDARRTRIAREEELLEEARQTTIERSWARGSDE